MSESDKDIGEQRAEAHVGMSFKSTLAIVYLFFVFAAILNGRHLYEGASERPYGPVRDAWMVATRPLYTLSTTLRMDRLRAFFEIIHEGEP